MAPGTHITIITSDTSGLQGRSQDWELRDTLLILLPGPTSLYVQLFRVPLSEKTVAEQVLKTGTGAINIDACRVSTTDNLGGGAYAKDGTNRYDGYKNWRYKRLGGAGEYKQPTGRWPSNLLLVHHEACVLQGTKKVQNIGGNSSGKSAFWSSDNSRAASKITRNRDADGMETIANWKCHSNCPVKILDEQSFEGGVHPAGNKTVAKNRKGSNLYGGLKPFDHNPDYYKDAGGASRFFPQFNNLSECLDWINRLINL